MSLARQKKERSFTQNLPKLMAESFPEDIFIDILLRLPAKSLMRFKCVSKRWRSLISDPGFVKSHLQRLKAGDFIPSQRIFINYCFSRCPTMTIDYEALDGSEVSVVVPHGITSPCFPGVVGSCDGLICINNAGVYLIYNPTTRECSEWPCSDLVEESKSIDKHGNAIFRGFGYDSRSDDYKIIEGILDDQIKHGEIWEVAIFSFKSGSWRRIQVEFDEESHLDIYGHNGVYWNGALHWCIEYWFLDVTVRATSIMSFDLMEEKFHREVPVPEVDGDRVFQGLSTHGSSLFIYKSNPRVEAWIMDDYGLWTKWFNIDSKPVFIAPLAWTRSGKIVLLAKGNRIIQFNPEDNTCKDYPILREWIFNDAIYLETLVSPHLGGEPSRI